MAYADPLDPRARAARIKHYQNNKQQYQERNRKKEESLKHFLSGIKSWPCVDCGVGYPPYVMQFDHLPGLTKSYEPAKLYKTGSWTKTIEEIMKCEVVCANCHAERTHARLVLAELVQRQEHPAPTRKTWVRILHAVLRTLHW